MHRYLRPPDQTNRSRIISTTMIVHGK
jgi:hypothetical protein